MGRGVTIHLCNCVFARKDVIGCIYLELFLLVICTDFLPWDLSITTQSPFEECLISCFQDVKDANRTVYFKSSILYISWFYSPEK